MNVGHVETITGSISQYILTVAVALPVNGTFDYALLKSMEEEVKVGCRVTVPFGSQVTTGYVLEKNRGRHRPGLKHGDLWLLLARLKGRQRVCFLPWRIQAFRLRYSVGPDLFEGRKALLRVAFQKQARKVWRPAARFGI